VPRRAARPALLLVVALLAASAFVALRWDGARDHQPLPRATAAVPEQATITSARSPRILDVLLAVAVVFALPAAAVRRWRVHPATRPRPGPALLRIVGSRGPPLAVASS
jgi:hypothetical protein